MFYVIFEHSLFFVLCKHVLKYYVVSTFSFLSRVLSAISTNEKLAPVSSRGTRIVRVNDLTT